MNMYEGDAKSDYTVINLNTAKKKIQNKGLNFSLKRFITAIITVYKINDVKFLLDKSGNAKIGQKWAIGDGNLHLSFRFYCGNEDNDVLDKLVEIYAGNEIDEFDARTHSTITIMLEHAKALSVCSLITALPLVFGYLLFDVDGWGKFIGSVLMFFGALLLILCSKVYIKMFSHEVIGVNGIENFITNKNELIDAEKKRMITTLAEEYAYDNGLSHEYLENCNSIAELNDKSFTEILAMMQ